MVPMEPNVLGTTSAVRSVCMSADACRTLPRIDMAMAPAPCGDTEAFSHAAGARSRYGRALPGGGASVMMMPGRNETPKRSDAAMRRMDLKMKRKRRKIRNKRLRHLKPSRKQWKIQ
jgi:hypothetical protein